MNNWHWKNMLIADIIAARNAGMGAQEIHDIVNQALNMTRSLPDPYHNPPRCSRDDDNG